MTDNFSNRELEHFFKDIRDDIVAIKIQTTKTNGRLTKVEKTLLIFGTALLVLLITNGSELVTFLMGII